jgi:hypothetical protein
MVYGGMKAYSSDSKCMTATRPKRHYLPDFALVLLPMRNMPKLAIYRFLRWSDPSSMGQLSLALTWLKQQVFSPDSSANGNESHWKAAKHLLRDIQGTIDLCLMFDAECGKRIILGYADADWGGDLDTRSLPQGMSSRSTAVLLLGRVAGNPSLLYQLRRRNTWHQRMDPICLVEQG